MVHDDRAGDLHSRRHAGVPKRLHNIGMRIEDDVVVTADRRGGADARSAPKIRRSDRSPHGGG